MKISKLFHWLYAFIMFLPVFAVGGKLAYTIFNKNAKDSYHGKIINYQEYKSNNLDNVDNGLTYEIDIRNLGNPTYTNNSKLIEFNSPELITFFQSHMTNQSELLNQANNFSLGYSVGESYNASITFFNNTTKLVSLQILNFQSYITETFTVIINNITTSGNYNQSVLPFGNFVKIIPIYDNSLDNAFYYAVDQVRDNVLFSWANNSFLATPITYVTDLFGMPSNSPIITYLSYWLDISIIWLTFDVILYVPLLVHRWLDKGVLE